MELCPPVLYTATIEWQFFIHILACLAIVLMVQRLWDAAFPPH